MALRSVVAGKPGARSTPNPSRHRIMRARKTGRASMRVTSVDEAKENRLAQENPIPMSPARAAGDSVCGPASWRESGLSSVCSQPVVSGAVFDLHGHTVGQGQGVSHGVEDPRDQRFLFVEGEVENEFVVNLQQHP